MRISSSKNKEQTLLPTTSHRERHHFGHVLGDSRSHPPPGSAGEAGAVAGPASTKRPAPFPAEKGLVGANEFQRASLIMWTRELV